MNKKQLADRAGVARSYISKLELGRFKRPSGEYLRRVANALHVPAEQLLSANMPTTTEPRPPGPDMGSLIQSGWLRGAMEDPNLREDTKQLLRRVVEQDYREWLEEQNK